MNSSVSDIDITAALNFVKVEDNGAICYWEPDRSGEWDEDCATGRKAAADLVSYIKRSNNPHILRLVLADMFRDGRKGDGVEVGFMSASSAMMVRGLFG